MISIHMTTARRFKSGLLVNVFESVLSQDYKDFEFIICDDASTDGTHDYLLSLQNRYAQVKVFRNEVNVNSVAVSLGRCFTRISPEAKYITWMFDDNVMRPGALTTLVNNLQVNNNLDFVYGTTVCHLKDGVMLKVGYHDPDYVSANVSMSSILVPKAGILIKRSVFDRVGWYDASIILRRSCDWDLFNRMIAAGCQFTVIPAELIDEFGILENDSLRNTFTTTFDVMRKYAEFRDQAGWRPTLAEALYLPVDRIPPGNWTNEEILLMYFIFLEYFLSVGHIAKAYEWALRLSVLPGVPWWVEQLKHAKDLDKPYSSYSAMGAFAGIIYGHYKTNNLQMQQLTTHIATLEQHLNSPRYRAVDAINGRLKSMPFIHSFLRKFLRGVYRTLKSVRAKHREALS